MFYVILIILQRLLHKRYAWLSIGFTMFWYLWLLISFTNSAKVEQSFQKNKGSLDFPQRRKLSSFLRQMKSEGIPFLKVSFYSDLCHLKSIHCQSNLHSLQFPLLSDFECSAQAELCILFLPQAVESHEGFGRMPQPGRSSSSTVLQEKTQTGVCYKAAAYGEG